MRTLVGLQYSPWSEIARWSLDHHGLAYKKEAYLPMLGEPLLRLRMGRLRGKVSVPVLFDDGAVIGDSMDIARHADRVGKGRPLFPAGREDEVLRWRARSEKLLFAGRRLVLHRLAESRAGLDASLPRWAIWPFRPLFIPVARLAVRYVARKYAATSPVGTLAPEITGALDELREHLEGRATILDAFSFADLVMACALQFLVPVADEHMRLHPATREVWTSPDLVEKYRDLVTWRDAIYAAHRLRG